MLEVFGIQGAFAFFAALSLRSFAFIATCLVETRSLSLQEVEAVVTVRNKSELAPVASVLGASDGVIETRIPGRSL